MLKSRLYKEQLSDNSFSLTALLFKIYRLIKPTDHFNCLIVNSAKIILCSFVVSVIHQVAVKSIFGISVQAG